MKPLFDEIRASDLQTWAKQPEARIQLPSLVQHLVFGSGAELRSCRFQTWEQTDFGGWDAVVNSERSGLFIPKGVSAWEFGAGGAPTRKLLEDFEKRSDNPLGLAKSKTTFCHVTAQAARSSLSKEEVGDLRRKHGWKAIQLIDSQHLANWIAKVPAAGLWFAGTSGRQLREASSLTRHWDVLSTIRGGLKPETFLAGRHQTEQQLTEWAGGANPAPFTICSFSEEDTRDALAAWWNQSGGSLISSPRTAVLVSTPRAWDILAAGRSPLLMIADGGWSPRPEQITAAQRAGHAVILRVCTGHADAVLPPLRRELLSEALRKGGMANEDAWKISGRASGSGAALKRLLAGAGTPEWAASKEAAAAAPLVLLGAWNVSNSSDREAAERIVGSPFKQLERMLFDWARSNHPLTRKSGPEWRIVNREEAWQYLIDSIEPQLLKEFESTAVEILSEIDPKYDLPSEERPFAYLVGRHRRYSITLRRSVGETLCLLSLRSGLSQYADLAPEIAGSIARKVLNLACDWRSWASLGESLSFIAESAPEVFLACLEQQGATERLRGLFEPERGPFPESNYVELLWALQRLVWTPRHVARVCRILLKLMQIDPGGNSSPRPASVFYAIFSPARPQSALTVQERCKVLDDLLRAFPEQAHEILVGMLPHFGGFVTSGSRPRFSGSVPFSKIQVLESDYWLFMDFVAERLAARIAGAKASRLVELAASLDRMPGQIVSVILDEIGRTAGSLSDQERLPLWETLRSESAQHAFHISAKWTLSQKEIAEVAATTVAIQPLDPVLLHAWRFVPQPDFTEGVTTETPWEQRHEADVAAQVSALQSILAQCGVDGPVRLAGVCAPQHAWLVGDRLAGHSLCELESTTLAAWLAGGDPGKRELAVGYLSRSVWMRSPQWLVDCGVTWSASAFGLLANHLPFGPDLWRALETLGPQHVAAYWSKVNVYATTADSSQRLEVFTALLWAGRPGLVLELINHDIYSDRAVSAEEIITAFERLRDATAQPRDEIRLDELPAHHVLTHVHQFLANLELSADLTVRAEEIEWFLMETLTDLRSLSRPVFLWRKMIADPAVFVEVVEGAGYRRDSATEPAGESAQTEMDTDNLDEPELKGPAASERWRVLCNELLGSGGQLPGHQGGSKIDVATLHGWLVQMRAVAQKRGISHSAEYVLGNLMLHAPMGEENVWPCDEVCAFIEEADQMLREGLSQALRVRQGWPGPLRDWAHMTGDRDHVEAIDTLLSLAGAHEVNYPKLSQLLRECAEAKRGIIEQLSRERLED